VNEFPNRSTQIWDSHRRSYEDYCVGSEVVTTVTMKITVLDLRFSRPWLWRLLCWIWGSHDHDCEDYWVGFEVLTSMTMKITVLDFRFSRPWLKIIELDLRFSRPSLRRLLCWIWGSHDHDYEDYCVGFEVLTAATVKGRPLRALRLKFGTHTA
jgi:hypothetical protein